MNVAKKLKRSIVFLLKIALFASLFAIFFGIFGINNPWLFDLSRTTGVTFVTFAVVGVALMSVYGGYAIGTQKSKPIIYSLTLATVITDLVTHLQLSIMNTSLNNNWDPVTGQPKFVYETPHFLLLVIALQIIVIIIFAYLGNFIYFSIEPPEKCCVIAASRKGLSEIIPKILKFKKQYSIENIIHVDCENMYDAIDKCDTIFVYEIPQEKRDAVIEYCYKHSKNVLADVNDVAIVGAKLYTIDDKSLVTYIPRDMTFEQRVMKRLIDIGFSLLGILLSSPFMLLAVIVIKLDDHGKILYRQKRLTKYSREFEVLKFRTMREENSVHESAMENDDRITRSGRILRKFRIDELPQFFNILRGEMSVVGPRPEMLENIKKYTDNLPEFSYRLRAKAGLTGLAQINGKYNTSPKDKLVLDLMYIEKFSIWQDLKIMFQTVTVFFKASESTEAFKEEECFTFDAGYGPVGEVSCKQVEEQV